MAQRSLPQAGTGVGDSGPYTSDQWAEFFQAVFTGDQEATQGPLIRVWNELEVTKAGLTITTDTGVGFVYGHVLIVDPAIAITVALAAAGQERYDRVVMVQNNTAAAYNTNLALPAAYAAGVPRNSARIAILQGAEAGAAVLPALITGAGGIYMVELARYLVDDAAVGAIDDRREFCLFSSLINTREDFVTPYLSYNQSYATWPLKSFPPLLGLWLEYEDMCRAAGAWIVPPNWDELTITITAVVVPESSGNIYSTNTVYIGACDEDPEASNVSSILAQIAVTLQINNCIQPVALTTANCNVGDILAFEYIRYANTVHDTVNDTVRFRGWIVSYGVR